MIFTLNQHNTIDISTKVLQFILYTRKVLEDNSRKVILAAESNGTLVFFDLFCNKNVNKSGGKAEECR